ncbi:nucleoside recognition domain-containing protein [Peribacillus sp. SCS-37]|uniref:nucleoside recognition domain-containing protein n=1 Tax=Paraperibacillus esterisolvens TaxID=3115296 RepID=UPI003905DA65
MFAGMLKRGLLSGLKTTWTLGRVIFPVTLIVSIIQYTPILGWIVNIISPLMKVLGLRGEAAIPLVLGNLLNLYAGIGGILSLDLTVKEVFIIAVMLSFSHNLLIETSVALKVGVRLWVILTVRIGLAFLSAIVINAVWSGGGELARYASLNRGSAEISGAWPILLNGVETALLGIMKLAIIVIPLMIVIQILKELKWLEKFSEMLGPLMKLLGMNKNASMTMASGLVLGLAYGAGVMIQAVQEDGVSRKDATLAFIFLVACHAVVEDTLIFVPLGIPVWPLLLIRVATAFILTMIISSLWKRSDTVNARKEASYEHI